MEYLNRDVGYAYADFHNHKIPIHVSTKSLWGLVTARGFNITIHSHSFVFKP